MDMEAMLHDKNLLVTGGTGSFGHKVTEHILSNYNVNKLIIYSRDEYKQWMMSKKFDNDCLRFFLGDVRDKERLHRAFEGVDYIIHAAALKQVPALEYNPGEAVKTNIVGMENVINAALDMNVKKVVGLSSDKAVNPINLYGATKLAAEKLSIAANVYGGRRTVFSGVRYGNVVGSRGSIIPFFKRLADEGEDEFPITHPEMTRFWITFDQSVELVMTALYWSVGGEIFVPKIPSMKIVDLARAIKKDCRLRIIGIRPGEKLHELLISSDESRNVKVVGKNYVILPSLDFDFSQYDEYPRVAENFIFSSDKNDSWISSDEISTLL